MAAINITVERVANISTLSAIYIGMYLDKSLLSTICFQRLSSSLVKLHGASLSILARSVSCLERKNIIGKYFCPVNL